MSGLPRIVAVVGTNASGKSELGVELAEAFGGEVVSADSRQVYRGLDVGSGKLPLARRRGVAHHLLDVAPVNVRFSVADYQRLAYAAIDGILERGAPPFLVGGTGLYVRAVLEGFRIPEVPADLTARKALEALSTPELVDNLLALEARAGRYVDLRNRRRLVRAIEILRSGGDLAESRRAHPRYQPLVLGLTWPGRVLTERIRRRLDRRLDGILAEVANLLAAGADRSWLDGLGLEYRHAVRWLAGGEGTREELVRRLVSDIRRFARRQMTWFRREKGILWLDTEGEFGAEAERRVRAFLGR